MLQLDMVAHGSRARVVTAATKTGAVPDGRSSSRCACKARQQPFLLVVLGLRVKRRVVRGDVQVAVCSSVLHQ